MSNLNSYKVKLATKVLLDHFGSTVADLGSILLKSSRGLHLSEINRDVTKERKSTIRDSLLVLWRHNLITIIGSSGILNHANFRWWLSYFAISNDLDGRISYRIEISSILRRLRFPRLLQLVQQDGIDLVLFLYLFIYFTIAFPNISFQPYVVKGLEVMQLLIREGQCSFERIEDFLFTEMASKVPAISKDTIGMVCKHLAAERFLLPLKQLSWLSDGSQDQILGKRNSALAFTDASSTIGKSDELYRINWDEVIRRLRHAATVNLVLERHGKIAADIVKAILLNSIAHEQTFFPSESAAMNVSDICRAMYSTKGPLNVDGKHDFGSK